MDTDDYDYEYSPLWTDMQKVFNYQSTPEVIGQNLVEDLLLNDPYILATYIQIFCEDEMVQVCDNKFVESMKTSFYELKNTEYYKNGTHLHHNGHHYGSDCNRCYYENKYIVTQYLIKKFIQMMNNKNIHYASNNDAIIALLEMSLATQHYYKEWCESSDAEIEKYVFSMKKRYESWDSLTNQEKENNKIKVLELIKQCEKTFDVEEYNIKKEKEKNCQEQVKKVWDECNQKLSVIQKRYDEETSQVRKHYTDIVQKIHSSYFPNP